MPCSLLNITFPLSGVENRLGFLKRPDITKGLASTVWRLFTFHGKNEDTGTEEVNKAFCGFITLITR